jgi:hypothetical protein
MMREAFPPSLPYGFAERVANVAMAEGRSTIWDFLFGMTPRASIAIGALAMLLAVIGFVGDGPNVIDAPAQYSDTSSIITLP